MPYEEMPLMVRSVFTSGIVAIVFRDHEQVLARYRQPNALYPAFDAQCLGVDIVAQRQVIQPEERAVFQVTRRYRSRVVDRLVGNWQWLRVLC